VEFFAEKIFSNVDNRILCEACEGNMQNEPNFHQNLIFKYLIFFSERPKKAGWNGKTAFIYGIWPP